MMNWTIRVKSETHSPDGKRHRFNRHVPDRVQSAPYFKQALFQWIEESMPPLFYGVGIHVITPLHHDIGVIDPDTRLFEYTS